MKGNQKNVIYRMLRRYTTNYKPKICIFLAAIRLEKCLFKTSNKQLILLLGKLLEIDIISIHKGQLSTEFRLVSSEMIDQQHKLLTVQQNVRHSHVLAV